MLKNVLLSFFKCQYLRWPTTVTAKQKVTALQTLLTAKQNELTEKQNELTAKQRKRVGQRLLFTSEMVRRVTVNKRNGDLFFPKNNGGVKKKLIIIILKEFIFIRFSFNQRRQRLAGV